MLLTEVYAIRPDVISVIGRPQGSFRYNPAALTIADAAVAYSARRCGQRIWLVPLSRALNIFPFISIFFREIKSIVQIVAMPMPVVRSIVGATAPLITSSLHREGMLRTQIYSGRETDKNFIKFYLLSQSIKNQFFTLKYIEPENNDNRIAALLYTV
jgi:hypothetical protein